VEDWKPLLYHALKLYFGCHGIIDVSALDLLIYMLGDYVLKEMHSLYIADLL